MINLDLKNKFILSILAAYALVGVLSVFVYTSITQSIIETLGSNYAKNQAILNKSKILSLIQRELALSLKMADSSILKLWALNENNQSIKNQATQELNSYKKYFKENNFFYIIIESGHYYRYNKPQDKNLTYTQLSKKNVVDKWYYHTLEKVEDFELATGTNPHYNITNLWLNMIVKHNGKKIAICGTGINITDFFNEIVHTKEKGLSIIVMGKDANILGHKQKKYVEHNALAESHGKADTYITLFQLMDSSSEQEKLKELLNSLVKTKSEVKTMFARIEGEKYLIAASYIKEIGWFTVSQIDISHMGNFVDFLPLIVVIIISLFFALLIMIYFLNRTVLKPILNLSNSAKEISMGNYNISLSVNKKDEIGLLTDSFNRMTSTIKDYTENLENKVHERTEQLSISNNKLTYYNKEITDSINYAKHIQSSILPDHKTLENSLKEYFILYKPRNIVGGDLYFYKNVNNSQLIAVADCTGHGVPGAFMTLIVSSALNHIVDKYQNPAQILKELNINIRKQLHQHNKTDFLSDDGLDIAICQITANKKSLIYAGAQFPMAYCKNNQVFMLKGDKQNVGYIRSKEDFEYINHEILLEGNEIFYLCSDGLFHQNGTNNRYPFGKKRYTQFLLEHHNLPLSRQKQLIEDLFLIYQGDAPQRDDLVLFGFKIF